VAKTRAALERMQSEITRLEANLEKALNSSDQDCQTVDCPDENGSSGIPETSQASPAVSIKDDASLSAASGSVLPPASVASETPDAPAQLNDAPPEVTYGQVEEVAQPALIDTENEFDLKFDPSPAVPNEIDATDVAENEATAAPQTGISGGQATSELPSKDAYDLSINGYENPVQNESTGASVNDQLQAQDIIDSSTRWAITDEVDTQLDYAVGQLQDVQRSLQETSDKELYLVPQGRVEGAVVEHEPHVLGGDEEYWMPPGIRLAPLSDTEVELQDRLKAMSEQVESYPSTTTSNPPAETSPFTPDFAGESNIADGVVEDASPGVSTESQHVESTRNQDFSAPDDASSPSLSTTQLSEPPDTADFAELQNWPPEGPVPEGSSLMPDVNSDWDPAGLEELQRAINGVEDAIGLQPSTSDVITSAAVPTVDLPQSLKSLAELAQRLDAGEGNLNLYDGSSGAGLSSIQVLADELATRLEDWPQLWNPVLPVFGKVLAYMLAAVGVGYLVLGFAGRQQQSGSNGVIEPDSVISNSDESSKALGQETSDNTDVTNWLVHSSASESSDSDAEGPVAASDSNSSSLKGTTANGQALDEEPKEKNMQVLPWVLNELDSTWSGSFDSGGSMGSASLSVSASYDDTTAVATVLPSNSAENFSLASTRNKPNVGGSISEDTSDVYDSRVQDIDTLAYRRREARFGTSGAAAQRSAIKEKLWWVVKGLGPTAAIVPGGEPIRADIEQLLIQLEGITPLETPLNIEFAADEQPITAAAKIRSKAHPDLLGTWRLEYASNTQVVQKNAMQHVLQLAEAVPGFGVSDVVQQLREDSEGDQILTENTAVVGLGPFGSWQISVTGIWQDNGGGICAKAHFQSFCVRPVEIMGFSADALPEVRVPVPMELQAEVEWCTTYCDKEFRIGRGTSGNMFVFRKEPNPPAKRKW